MLIPFNKLSARPEFANRNYDDQYCSYRTSSDDTTYPIMQHTKFPSFQDILAGVAMGITPEVKDIYYVVYPENLVSDHETIELPAGAKSFRIDDEPYYNSITGKCDIFMGFIYFENMKDAYNYAITCKK